MYLEEFEVGQQFELERVSLTEEEIFSFADKYDPQPIHVDESFANESVFKGIIASGFQTVSIIWGSWIRANKIGTEIIGGIGLDFLKWTAPVRANDVLSTIATVVETIPSSKGGKGTLVVKFDVTNQDEVKVLETQARVIIKSKN